MDRPVEVSLVSKVNVSLPIVVYALLTLAGIYLIENKQLQTKNLGESDRSLCSSAFISPCPLLSTSYKSR